MTEFLLVAGACGVVPVAALAEFLLVVVMTELWER
jgi:hypothetical protein